MRAKARYVILLMETTFSQTNFAYLFVNVVAPVYVVAKSAILDVVNVNVFLFVVVDGIGLLAALLSVLGAVCGRSFFNLKKLAIFYINCFKRH